MFFFLKWSGNALYTVVVGLLFMYLLLVGVGGNMRNNCHLAANFGTSPRIVFLGGVGPLSFHLGRCEVVFKNYFRVSLLSAASSYIDDTAHTEN